MHSDGERVSSKLAGRGNIDAFDVVDPVGPGDRVCRHGGRGPRPGERHDVREKRCGAIGCGNFQVEVVDQVARAAVCRGLGGAGGVGPGKRGADGTDAVPSEGIGADLAGSVD